MDGMACSSSGGDDPWIRDRRRAAGNRREALEVVRPAHAVWRARRVRETVMDQHESGAVAVGLERHLDAARSRLGDRAGPDEAPREDDPVRRLDDDVLAQYDVAAVGLDAEPVARPRSSSAATPIQSTIR